MIGPPRTRCVAVRREIDGMCTPWRPCSIPAVAAALSGGWNERGRTECSSLFGIRKLIVVVTRAGEYHVHSKPAIVDGLGLLTRGGGGRWRSEDLGMSGSRGVLAIRGMPNGSRQQRWKTSAVDHPAHPCLTRLCTKVV